LTIKRRRAYNGAGKMVAEGGVSQALHLYREGRFEDALAALDARAEAVDPALGAYLRGIVLKDSGRDGEAVECFDRALALRPDLERAHYHRGTARFLAGDKQGALRDLERAVETEPDFLFAVYNLGVAAVGARDWDRARRAFARCLELDPAQREEYVSLLVEIGRGQAQEEVYAQGHRLKNLLGVVGDHYRTLLGELLDLPEGAVPAPTGARARAIEGELFAVYQDMVQFLRAVDTAPPAVDLLDIRDVIDKCLFALSPRLRDLRIERRFDAWVPEVIADRKSLGEALANILTNAVEALQHRAEEAGPGGAAGVIEIAVRAIDDVPHVPGIDSVEVEVRDNGPGIAPEHLARIFEFGYTTKRFGSGLGLSYADRVVRAHGGRITVRSPQGEGTTVSLVLPASPCGAPNLRTLSLRSLLFEDLRALAIRGSAGEATRRRRRAELGAYGEP
jgi:signal transduction histidine kinase